MSSLQSSRSRCLNAAVPTVPEVTILDKAIPPSEGGQIPSLVPNPRSNFAPNPMPFLLLRTQNSLPRFASPSYRVPRITDDCMEFFSSPAKGGCRNGTWMLGPPHFRCKQSDRSPGSFSFKTGGGRGSQSERILLLGLWPLACHSAEGGTGIGPSPSLGSINTAVGHDASRGAIPPSAVVRKGVRALEHSLDSLSFQATRAWPPSKNGPEGHRGHSPPTAPLGGPEGHFGQSSPLPSSVGQWGSEAKAPPTAPLGGPVGRCPQRLSPTLADSISIEWTYDNQLFPGAGTRDFRLVLQLRQSRAVWRWSGGCPRRSFHPPDRCWHEPERKLFRRQLGGNRPAFANHTFMPPSRGFFCGLRRRKLSQALPQQQTGGPLGEAPLDETWPRFLGNRDAQELATCPSEWNLILIGYPNSGQANPCLDPTSGGPEAHSSH
eukprot:gene12192-15315_t